MEYCPETLDMRIHRAFHSKPEEVPQSANRETVLITASTSRDFGNPTVDSINSRPTEERRSADNGLLPPPISASQSSPNTDPVDSIDWESIVDIMLEINIGLIYIHSRGVVHRDLKPKNSTPLQCLLDRSLIF
jgi:hypothetical protein